MVEQVDMAEQIGQVRELLSERLGAKGSDLRRALVHARPDLPRRVRRQAALLAAAEPLTSHPKLRLTLDPVALGSAAEAVKAHLSQVDRRDLRKGWWLGLLGGLVFNLMLLAGLVLAWLIWRGVV